MKCPFCSREMRGGVMEGDGRTKLRWIPDDKLIKWVDRLSSNIGIIPEAEYVKLKFTLRGEYCANCGKFITDIRPVTEDK